MNDSIRNPRTLELLIERATVGLSVAEQQELNGLLLAADVADDFSFDSIVALLQGSSVEVDMKPLPRHVRSRVLDSAEQFVSAEQDPDSELLNSRAPAETTSAMEPDALPRGMQRTTASFSRREWLAWLATAASLALAAFLWLTSRDAGPDSLIALSDQSNLNSFLADLQPDDLLIVELEPGNDASGAQGTGTVYWSRQAKRGFVKVDNVAPNQRDRQQYQLWVIDRDRGIDDRPNAGVFDIPAAGNHVFEFRSDLQVTDAQGFAVTVEKPGGVSKSDLSKIALVNLGT